MFRYLKYYFEPKSQEVHQKAYDAAAAHYTDKPFRSYDLRTRDFVAFQRGFINAYRRAYARNKLSQ